MHREVSKPEPGKCPKCGMNLVPVQRNDRHGGHQDHEMHEAHDKHAGHHTQDFLKRF